MAARIVVIGSTNVDFVVKVPHLPAMGETVSDGSFFQSFGGKGANTAVAAARTAAASIKTAFVTTLGDDLYAAQIVENFRLDGLDVTHVHVIKAERTGCAVIMLDEQGRNYLAIAPGSNYALGPAEVERHAGLIRSAELVVMQMEIRVDTIRRVLELCDEAGVPVLFNYAPVRSTELEVSSKMTGLVVNETEAAQLTGIAADGVDGAKRAATELLRRGPRFVVVTLGGEGCVVRSKDLDHHLPALKVTPVDTTAAGDTFCGSLAAALVEGRKLPEAVTFAGAAASLACTKFGAQISIPTRAEVDAFLARAK